MSAAAQVAVTLAGWTGAICAVVAYGLVTLKRATPDSGLFQGLNVVGAALLCVSATVYGAWPSAVVNVIWVGIGIVALRTLLVRRAASRAVDPATVVLDGSDAALAESALSESTMADATFAQAWEAASAQLPDADEPTTAAGRLAETALAPEPEPALAGGADLERNSAPLTPVAA